MHPIHDLPELVQNAIGLVKQHTSGKDAAFAGSIMPQWLPAAMPSFGRRCSKMDMIALLLLTEIINAYRPRADGVFFGGSAFQINRSVLAKRWRCKQGDISRVLTFLKDEGLVLRTHRAHMGVDGEHAGKAAFAVPVVEKIVERIKQAKRRSKTLGAPFSGTSPTPTAALDSSVNGTSHSAEGHFSTKSAKGASKTAEAGGGSDGDVRATRSPASASTGPDGPTLGSAVLDAPEARLCKTKPPNGATLHRESTPVGRKSSTSGGTAAGQLSAQGMDAAEFSAPQEAANHFIALWVEAIERSRVNPIYRPDDNDRRAALKLFMENQNADVVYLINCAIQAWGAPPFDGKKAHSDRFYHCRRAFTISEFLSCQSKISGQLYGAGHRMDKRAHYRTLRRYFLDSELDNMGFAQLVMDNMGRGGSSQKYWENCDPQFAQAYYTQRNRPVPDFVQQSASPGNRQPPATTTSGVPIAAKQPTSVASETNATSHSSEPSQEHIEFLKQTPRMSALVRRRSAQQQTHRGQQSQCASDVDADPASVASTEVSLAANDVVTQAPVFATGAENGDETKSPVHVSKLSLGTGNALPLDRPLEQRRKDDLAGDRQGSATSLKDDEDRAKFVAFQRSLANRDKPTPRAALERNGGQPTRPAIESARPVSDQTAHAPGQISERPAGTSVTGSEVMQAIRAAVARPAPPHTLPPRTPRSPRTSGLTQP